MFFLKDTCLFNNKRWWVGLEFLRFFNIINYPIIEINFINQRCCWFRKICEVITSSYKKPTIPFIEYIGKLKNNGKIKQIMKSSLVVQSWKELENHMCWCTWFLKLKNLELKRAQENYMCWHTWVSKLKKSKVEESLKTICAKAHGFQS